MLNFGSLRYKYRIWNKLNIIIETGTFLHRNNNFKIRKRSYFCATKYFPYETAEDSISG